MKQFFFLTILSIAYLNNIYGIAPFFRLAEKKASIEKVSVEITSALTNSNYEIIGSYYVGNNANKMVIVFTNSEIEQLALGYADKGGLAIAQKVGLVYSNGKTTISILNPMYMFHAYFQKGFVNKAEELTAQADSIKSLFEQMNYTYTPFGGDLRPNDLHEYQYMLGMPEFSDAIKLKNFASFEEGVATIKKHLSIENTDTRQVYALVFEDKEIAVFGIGLVNAEKGEPYFLPIIGENQLAAMPYEIILQGTTASMLNGRYRLALYWPDLTMSTFTKIMSTPGYIEQNLQMLCE